MTATYVDAQLTMMLTQISAGEDPDTVQAHADLAFAVLTSANSFGQYSTSLNCHQRELGVC